MLSASCCARFMTLIPSATRTGSGSANPLTDLLGFWASDAVGSAGIVAMSGECQLPLQQPHQQLQQQRYRLPFEVQSANPWLAACRRDAATVPGSTTAPPGTADYWLRHRVDHQQVDPCAPGAASCYFSRHQGKFREGIIRENAKTTMHNTNPTLTVIITLN